MLLTRVCFKSVAADVRRRKERRFALENPPPHVGGYANSTRSKEHGGTLLEYVCALGISMLVLVVFAPLSLYSGRAFAQIANYVDLNASNLRALDRMTKEIRQASQITAFQTNSISVDMGTNSSPITFTYSAADRTVIRSQDGVSRVLLSDCDSLQFSLYKRIPVPGTWEQYAATNFSTAKVVIVNWLCSRKILGIKANTENAQMARIVIRKT